ncbi:MAG: phosphonate ABC transporter, permease protein PhnE [Ilumatobacter sp.]|uniref:phosphonate ABC transporter, permease protein PhnE n=1 Tax=Ilumatobacter sp. TaxID=1967498 RepID=UPI0026228530|nr:phosphonate ABC transporter, permease protein PhnE [Ilumatobacter sp.]MDJ0769085.1 phosphonate ABC transporter, permease protein PhnE [Ilumatobacter sp.]
MSEITANQVARPRKPRPHATSYVITAGLIAFTIFSAQEIGFKWSSFVDMWTNPLWDRFWPIPWDWVLDRDNVLSPLVETFQIAILSTIIGCGLALPVGFAMSKLTSPNAPVFWFSRTVMSVVRAIPDLLWGKLLVTAIGIGAFAGAWALTIFSLAVMVKLFSETVDAADPRPLEAARAAGGRHTAAVRSGVLPDVFPAYVAYALYVFELNIRASLVLGLVGAGGIGRVVETQRSTFNFDRLLGILVIMFVIVFTIEQVSVAIRKRLV